MSEKLIAAVYRKDHTTIEKMLADGVSIDARDEDGRTALMHAVLAEDADPEMIGFLTRHGADVNIEDTDQKWTALHFAARDQRAAIVRVLLDTGANVDAQDSFGNTPLWRCVMNSAPDFEIVKRLLARGADPNKKNRHGVSPRDTTVNTGNEELVKVLDSR